MYLKDNRKKIVFLGTPFVVAQVLNTLVVKGKNSSKIILVVTQPPSRSTRSREEIPSPVHAAAHALGIPVLAPPHAKDPQFLSDLAALEPDLCVTAAYGNYLPSHFLSLPKYGTVNLHPSLLPLYRGAAPVQRTLENGDKETGITLLYTVKEMDAGPIIASQKYTIPEDIKAPELLNHLFYLGAELLVKNLNFIFQGDIQPQEQIHANATYAKKILPAESFLDFNLPSTTLHNKVKAFAGWPGTKAILELNSQALEYKIITTALSENERGLNPLDVYFSPDSIDICCGDGKVLKIKEIQPTGKKVLTAKEFQNGIYGKILKIQTPGIGSNSN